MIMVLGIPILLVMIFAAIKSKIADIVVGSIFIIGGLVFNMFLNSTNSLDMKREAFFNNGTTDLASGAYLIIGIGVICIIIGIVRFIAEKNKSNKETSKNL